MLSDAERLSIKATVKRASDAVGGQKVLGAASRRIKAENAHARVSEYANGRELADERFVPLDIAVEFDRLLLGLGLDPMNLGNAARLLGYTLVRAPGVAPAPSTVEALLQSAEASAHAVSAGWTAHADGVLTTAERAELLQHIDRAVAAFEAFRLLLGEAR